MRSPRFFAALALLVLPLLAACGDDNKKPAEPEWSLPAAVRDLPAGPIGDVAPPPAVIAWGGAADVDRLAGGLQAFVQQVSPIAPRVLDLAQDELRRRLSLTKLEGIDWKRPARLAVFDPKANPKAQIAVVLGLASKDQLLAGISPTVPRKANDEGNAVTYRDDLGRTICLSFVDDSVVVTWDKKQFAANVELFVRLARSTVPEQQAFYLSAKNVAKLYAKEIDDTMAQVKQQVAAPGAQVPGVQTEVGARVLSWLVDTFKELDRVEVLPRLPEDGALVAIRLHPAQGSTLAASFKAIEARPHDLLAKLPADATMFASFSTNPDAVDGLTTRLVEWAMSVGFGGKVPEGVAQTMKEYFSSTGGQIALAAHKPLTGDGLALTTLITVRDEEKLRGAMRRSKEMFKDKATLDAYKKSGVIVDYREGAYKVGAVPVDAAEMKVEKGKSPLAQLGPFGDAIGELSTNHTAVSKDLAIIGYGKDARKTIEAFLGGKVTGGLDKAAGPSRALRVAGPSPVGIFYISPVEVAKRASLGGQNPLAESLKDLASTTGIALSFAAKDGALEIVIDVPVEQARNVAQALGRAKAVFPQ
jgi:hypothetical protein